MSETGGVRRALALLALCLAAACGGSGSALTAATPTPAAYHGVEPDPVPTRPSWLLTDTDGHAYDFQAETAGHPTFVYFGYTNCPDECPTAMADIAAALRRTTPAIRAEVRVVFVTTDVKRDTAPVLRRWLDQFSTQFVGLLGTQAQVDAAQRATGIQPAYPDGVVPTIAGHPDEHVHKPGTAPHQHFGPLGYAVTHSAVIFAYDAANRLPVVYPGGVTPSDIAADLPVLAHP
ncbi:MAG TPA: SCO family protein [Mycobacteriales bacterium]|nr:SCO family protein [Mycobacteriales bacterium]